MYLGVPTTTPARVRKGETGEAFDAPPGSVTVSG
jgi:hypothetical protein